MSDEEPDWDELIAELSESGVIESVYLDEEGETVLEFDLDKLEVLYPQMFESLKELHMQEIEETCSELVDKGYLEMSFEDTDDGMQPVYQITEAGRQALADSSFEFEVDVPPEIG